MKFKTIPLFLACVIGLATPAATQNVIVSGPKNTTSHGYYVIKFRVAFDPVNRVYMQVWDDQVAGRARGQFLDTLGNRIGGAFNLTSSGGTGWVNVTFGGPPEQPRFLVTYLVGNGSNNPKYARLIAYTEHGPSYGNEVPVADIFGEWSDADISQSVWTGSQFAISWRWQGASYLRGLDINGNLTGGPQSLGDGLDVEVNPNLACGGGVCLAHGFAFGTAFGAVGGSWGRFFDPNTLAPIGPVFYSDDHAGLMEDQRVAYNSSTNQFHLVWVRLKQWVDFRVVTPGGQLGALDLSQSLPGGQISLAYNPATQSALVAQIWPDLRVAAVEIGADGYPMRDGNGAPHSVAVSNSWQAEGNPPLYYAAVAANPVDGQWFVGYSALTEGRATVLQRGGGGGAGPPATLALSTASWFAPQSGGAQGVSVTATPGLGWGAVSNQPWLTIAGGSGSGSGGFTMFAASNGSSTARAATVTVGTQTIQVTQAGAAFQVAGQPVVRFDGDAATDVFTYSPTSGFWSRWIGQAGGGFLGTIGPLASGYVPYAANFDGDGMTDIFLSNPNSGQWFKLLSSGSRFSLQSSGAWNTGWQKFVMELDGDGISDLFLYDPSNGYWYKAISTPSGFVYYQGQWNPGWEVTPLNLNGDQFGDMFLFNRSTRRWFWVLGQPGGGFSYPREGFWPNAWQIQTGDFNGDGLSDLFVSDPATGLNYTCLNNGSDFNYAGTQWTPGWTPYIADLDGDGADDLFIYQPGTGAWFKLIGNRGGQFGEVAGGTWATGWEIRPADFNGDGRSDLLLYNRSNGQWFQAFNLVNSSFSYATGFWDSGLAILVGK